MYIMENIYQLKEEQQIINNILIFENKNKSTRILEKENIIIFSDYDGTLVDFYNDPEKAIPNKELLIAMEKLGQSKNIEFVLISGRDKNFLPKHFGNINGITLVAEHGAWIKESNNEEWKNDHMLDVKENQKKTVKNILENFTKVIVGSFIEEKNYSIVWHYRTVNINANVLDNFIFEMEKEIKKTIKNINDIDVTRGNKILEIKRNDINKGIIVKKIMLKKNPTFAFSMGDDIADEEMHKVLNAYENTITIKVGLSNNTNAKYQIHDYKKAIRIIKILSNI